MINSLASMKALRLATAVTLVLWVSGIGCVFGCKSLEMSGAAHGAIAVRDATPAASMVHSGAHSCCAKHHASIQPMKTAGERSSHAALSSKATFLPFVEVIGETMGQCPMALNASALGTKARTDEAASSVGFEPPRLPLIDVARHNVPFAPSFYSNRGHTYLRCCVFLI